MVYNKIYYVSPKTRVYVVKIEGFICTSVVDDSKREDYIPEDWD